MSESAKLHKIAVSAAAATDGAVRPKVLRRPAQFSPTAISEPITAKAIIIAPELPPIEKPVAARTWQNDGRFAVALLSIVVVVNLVVMYWLSTIPHTSNVTYITQSTKPMSAEESQAAANSVTLFAPSANATHDEDVDGMAPVNILDDRISKSLHD